MTLRDPYKYPFVLILNNHVGIEQHFGCGGMIRLTHGTKGRFVVHASYDRGRFRFRSTDSALVECKKCGQRGFARKV